MQTFDQVFNKRLSEILMEHTGKTLIFLEVSSLIKSKF